jgi:hypothetical protein
VANFGAVPRFARLAGRSFGRRAILMY